MSWCLGCNAVESRAHILHDGTKVCESCPEYKIECEAKEVLAKPLHARRKYLAKLDANRKTLERAGLLRARMTAIHKARAE